MALAALSLTTGFASAQVPMTGTFRAEATCMAPPSIRNPDDNPGNVTVEAGVTYELLGRNAVPGSHYLIRIPGAEPDRRWVAYGCGTAGEIAQEAQLQPASPAPAPVAIADEPYVLAVNWPSAFCEDVPRARECRTGRSPLRFALHGLWPQSDTYCDVSRSVRVQDEAGRWDRLPQVHLRRDTRNSLAQAMPGVQSALERHQWVKHGTCSGLDADRYFQHAIRLLEELNESQVRALFTGHVGRQLDGRAIRAAFDAAFGRGAGNRVLVDCVEVDGRRLIRELRIAVASPTGGASLADLIAAGETQPRGCRTGEVDAPGIQGRS